MEPLPLSFLPHVDELLMEYLLFRGFTKSFQVFNAERKRSRVKGFDVEQILSQLLVSVQSYQIESILETWKFLKARFFNHLDASYAATVYKLEIALLRLYVVNAVKTGHREKAVEFFKSFANQLNATIPANEAEIGDSWCRWFILPYLEHPETDPYFQVFFSRDWLEAFVTSFRNFLALVFRNLPLPKLLAFQLTRLEEPSLKLRLKASQAECSRLRRYNVEANAKIKQLEEAGQQLHSMLRLLVQQRFSEHFTGARQVTEDINANGLTGMLSPQQLRELVALFGVSNSSNGKSRRSSPRLDAVSLSVSVLQPSLATDGDAPLSPPPLSTDDLETPLASPVRDGPATKRASLIRSLNAPTDSFRSDSRCRYSGNGQFVAQSARGSREIHIWSTNAVLPTPTSTIPLSSPLRCMDWLWMNSPQQYLVFGLENGSVILWNVEEQNQVATFSFEDGSFARELVCAQGASILSCTLGFAGEVESEQFDTSSDQLRVLEVQSNVIMEHGVDSSEVIAITCMAWNKPGTLLAIGNSGGHITIIDVEKGRAIASWHAAAGDTCGGPMKFATFDSEGFSLFTMTLFSSELIEWSLSAILEGSPRGSGESSASDDVLDQLATKVPPVTFTYRLETPTSASADDRVVRFNGSRECFLVSDAASTSCRVYQLGQEEPINATVPVTAAVMDADWHPVLPICCTAYADASVLLWDLKSVVGIS